MAETEKKVNTIKSIGKKVANNGDANDYVYIPIGADSDNIDRPNGSTVEESLENIESDKVEFIPVETLPTENIKTYPFIYALVNASAKRGIFYEYKNSVWIKYGNSSDGIWVGTREECLEALKKNEIEKGTIVFVIKKTENSEDVHKHDYVCQITKEPTYSETGTKLYTCLLCLESYEEEIPALIDSINPTGVIRIGDNEYCTWKDTISFNTYCNETQTVTVEATDNETGIKEIAYYLADTASSESDLAAAEWTSYTTPFNIEPNNNYIVYARLKDNADNVTYICSDGIVLDNIAPVFNGLEDGGTYSEGTVITVGEGETLTVNGEPVELVNNTYALNTADNYILSLTDRAGNSSSISIAIEIHQHVFVDGVCTGCGISEELANNWDYIIDENSKTIQLTNYKGESNDVVVNGTYNVNGQTYNTILNSHYENYNNYDSPFKNKKTIQSIIINSGVISYETSGLFADLSALNNLNLSGLDTTNVKNMNGMFYECINLLNLNLSSLDTSNVESMRDMFCVNSSWYDDKMPCFRDLNVNALDMSKVIDMCGMFCGIKQSEIDLSMMNLSNVINFDSVFQACKNLRKVKLPFSLKILGEMCFYGTNLTSIGEVGSGADLEIFSTVRYIGKSCFGECEELTNVVIPEGVKSIGRIILETCRNVSTLTIPSTINNFEGFYENYSYNLFGGIYNNLKTLYYNTEYGSNCLLGGAGSEDGFTVYFGENVVHLPNIFYYTSDGSGRSSTNVSNVIINGNVETIPKYFLSSEKKVKNITLPNTLKTINQSAFSNCSNNNLDIIIPNGVKEIGEFAFYKVPHIHYNGTASGSPWGALAVN